MNRSTMLLFLCACLLTPARANADDGGWLDWLYRMDPKFYGAGTEIHLLCLDRSGAEVQHCEQGWKNLRRLLSGHLPQNETAFDAIKHEFDLRVAFYWKYGATFPEIVDPRALHALKMMVMYHYHLNRRLELGGGAGLITFSGKDIARVTGGILTPLSVVVAPWKGRAPWLTFIVEESYIVKRVGLGVPGKRFSRDGEWNFSVATGFDLRRMPVFERR
jgi:hypothetical protein